MEDYYKILEVSQQATFAEIKAAYRLLCQEYHPDKLPPGTPDKARKHIEERFKQINTAYSVISNPELRESYDLNHSDEVGSSHHQCTTKQSRDIFEPDKLRQVTERLEALKNNIELEYKETQVEADRFVKQQIKGLGYKEEDLEGHTMAGKIGNSIFAICLFFLGIRWMASGDVFSFVFGLVFAGFWLVLALKTISSPTLSIKTAQKIKSIKDKASERKLNAQKKQQQQLEELKQHQQKRIDFFKSIPISMISEDYILNLTDEDQLYLLQSLNQRSDAAELGQNVKAVAQVAIGVGLLAVLFGLN
jgi:curved DNA-binding protein CbpA